jgi:HlyD family secretion protein
MKVRCAAGIGALLLLAGCGLPSASGTAPDPGSLQVRRGTVQERFLMTGELRAIRSWRLVTPRTDSWMVSIRWLAPEGVAVRAGEPVVQFDPSAVEARVKDRDLAVTQAEASLEQTGLDLQGRRLEQELGVLRLRVARDKARLLAEVPEALTSRREHQQRQLDLQRAEVALQKSEADLASFEIDAAAQLERLQAELAKARGGRDEAAALLERLTLRAPADGVLQHGTHPWEGRKWQVGDNCWAGTIVAEVPDLSVMLVEAALSDVDDGRIAPGLAVRCRPDTYPELELSGRILGITRVAQPPDRTASRRSFGVQIELESSDSPLLRPGMSVKVEVLGRTHEGSLVVPRGALWLGGAAASGNEARLRLRDGREVPVVLAGCDATDCALAQGPAEGTALEAVR